MHLVQTMPVTSRAVNRVVVDVAPTLALVLLRQRGDDQRGP